MNHIEVCDMCCRWVEDMRGQDAGSVAATYPGVMRRVLVNVFGMSVSCSADFVKNACFGNWERFHETDHDRELKAKDFASMLLDDMFYCSDRWSWDRVIRIQWLYQMTVRRLRFSKEEDND